MMSGISQAGGPLGIPRRRLRWELERKGTVALKVAGRHAAAGFKVGRASLMRLAQRRLALRQWIGGGSRQTLGGRVRVFEVRNMLVSHRRTLFQHFESMRMEVLLGMIVSAPYSREGRMTTIARRWLLSAVKPVTWGGSGERYGWL